MLRCLTTETSQPSRPVQMSNMPSLPNAHTRRITACAMLFVWLFALASGVANACLVEPRGHQTDGSTHLQVSATSETPTWEGLHAEGNFHDDNDSNGGTTKELCLRACDDGSQSLLKHSSSFDLADPGQAPFMVTAWAAEVQLAPASVRARDFRLPERGPPVRVLFSRLAL